MAAAQGGGLRRRRRGPGGGPPPPGGTDWGGTDAKADYEATRTSLPATTPLSNTQ